MKRRDLIRKLESNGWYLARNGSNHDIYTDGTNSETIPRHSEIKEQIAKSIMKRWGDEITPLNPYAIGGTINETSIPNYFNTSR